MKNQIGNGLNQGRFGIITIITDSQIRGTISTCKHACSLIIIFLLQASDFTDICDWPSLGNNVAEVSK